MTPVHPDTLTPPRTVPVVETKKEEEKKNPCE